MSDEIAFSPDEIGPWSEIKLEIIESVGAKIGEDNRPQRPPGIGILGQRNQDNAHGQLAAVAVKVAQ